ncbi:MAG: benzoyl-CoA-dihydrodiol lyase [Planctomycetes bacterium]|nr:benzoyl-CoA-dihydrodiol lyase [Planctomycetota bacterium]
MESEAGRTEDIAFETHPADYTHWRLRVEGPVAWLDMDVKEDRPLRPGYLLKLNSYDLGVDIELADAARRLRFEHPEVRVVVLGSPRGRVFCAGANIRMLGSSTHAFKVNFCRYTNETRLAIEDAQRHSGQHWIAALGGTTAGGGYELALACNEILLVDDGSTAVSLPEVPLLGVLPGTGGLTRVTDKRRVRRDRADVFCTLGEGVRAPRALEWGLVDAIAPRSRFQDLVQGRVEAALARPPRTLACSPGLALEPLSPGRTADGWSYRCVDVALDRRGRTATLSLRGPEAAGPQGARALRDAGGDLWHLRAFRELDDALLRLRFHEESLGLVLLKTEGDVGLVLEADRELAAAARDSWFAREVELLVASTLRRLDVTARSLFALVGPGSSFAGSLLELALAADRAYALDQPGAPVTLAVSPLNLGPLPTWQEGTRLAARGVGGLEDGRRLDAAGAAAAGLVTYALDALDWEDEVRVAIEERASLSPDALTGLEANLRFPGQETMATRIFGRLSAWQNWIFQRPNAVGERGALTLYGEPERPAFDWRRT